ncbi:hypothetical protein [Geochorda subterranea]|uniref:Uncharacterized protein n=1 Tax=Geochorda subterranea TaxID=3109564 RepID=A0ABZ1BS00_9FIRM|nr:hypothetical protein [Limnochorda sp. LNt]WRP14983.1 hypothetical protein VLY81_02070 [Limnochorda sp. LNt]
MSLADVFVDDREDSSGATFISEEENAELDDLVPIGLQARCLDVNDRSYP